MEHLNSRADGRVVTGMRRRRKASQASDDHKGHISYIVSIQAGVSHVGIRWQIHVLSHELF